MRRPFFCDPHFYPSPPKSWHLPTYAKDAAIQLAHGNYRTFRSKNPPNRSLEFVDIEALESDGETPSNATNSHSRITLSSSDHSDSSITLSTSDRSDSD